MTRGLFMFEILLFIALVIYLYRDYQKAKLEGWTKNDYIRSWVKGIRFTW